MAQGVKGHQDMERMAKIREQKHEERRRQYHLEILSGDPMAYEPIDEVLLPSTQDCDSVRYLSVL